MAACVGLERLGYACGMPFFFSVSMRSVAVWVVAALVVGVVIGFAIGRAVA
jgi:hypothetical protein